MGEAKRREKLALTQALEVMAVDTPGGRIHVQWDHTAIRESQKWLSAYDLQKYTAGFSKCKGVKVGSATVQLVCEEYATRRRQFKKARLN
ncbi:hypothetical protein [Polaromonas naphthalenivorans]|uniref:Uncharacterized protein n=1 Tax=Polaromonas naphthalenivorans (strain CJ2) TaxID=365044 RepID=A1VQE1_POLNA|nr:hypothetical protein [Polaromonas naphthalenivorans]ABM37869.1 hypothetical protein Pnap_2566 [Polaromonas naphthalenivorans CJ2]